MKKQVFVESLHYWSLFWVTIVMNVEVYMHRSRKFFQVRGIKRFVRGSEAYVLVFLLCKYKKFEFSIGSGVTPLGSPSRSAHGVSILFSLPFRSLAWSVGGRSENPGIPWVKRTYSWTSVPSSSLITYYKSTKKLQN